MKGKHTMTTLFDIDDAIAQLKQLGYRVSKPKTPKSDLLWDNLTEVNAARAMFVHTSFRFEGDTTPVKSQVVYDGSRKVYRLGPAVRAACDRWRYRQAKNWDLSKAAGGIDSLYVPPFTSAGDFSYALGEINDRTFDYRQPSANRFAA
jgi:hypothetical protein